MKPVKNRLNQINTSLLLRADHSVAIICLVLRYAFERNKKFQLGTALVKHELTLLACDKSTIYFLGVVFQRISTTKLVQKVFQIS